MAAYPGFLGPSGQVQSPVSDLERLVNMYYEPADVDSGRPALYPTPGMRSYITGLPDTNGRALRQMNGRTLGVVGAGIYEFFSTQTFSRYFTVAQDANPAQIEFNGTVANQALFATGTNGYLLNLATNGVTQVLTGDCYQIGTLDTYLIAFNPITGRIRISAAGDGTTWDPTQFQSTTKPDAWKAMIVRAPDIWLIGDQSGDFWYNAGNFPFPFAPRTGFTHYYGIIAPFSLAASSRTVMWLSKNQDGAGLLVRADGYAPQPVGSYAFDNAMAMYQATSTIADAEGQMIQWGGHVWYVLRFPAADHTWVYDLRTGKFFEVGHFASSKGDWDIWSPRCHCLSFGQHLVADTSNQISVLDSTVGTEANGDPIVRQRIPPSLVAENGARVFVDRFELGMQPGLGTQFGQGQNPTAMVSWSADFGRTWGNEIQMAIGQVGQYSKQAYHGPIGSSLKALVPKVTFSDPVPFRLSGASVMARGVARAEGR